MKYFLESTWAPYVVHPQTIDEWYDVKNGDKKKNAEAVFDLFEEPWLAQAIATGEFLMTRHELDFLRKNHDATHSLAFYQPNKDIALQYVEAAKNRSRPALVAHQVIAVPDPGEERDETMLSYNEQLEAGLRLPFSFLFSGPPRVPGQV